MAAPLQIRTLGRFDEISRMDAIGDVAFGWIDAIDNARDGRRGVTERSEAARVGYAVIAAIRETELWS